MTESVQKSHDGRRWSFFLPPVFAEALTVRPVFASALSAVLFEEMIF
jgi:hypothetical protein